MQCSQIPCLFYPLDTKTGKYHIFSPDGIDMQKNPKTNLKTLVSPLLMRFQGSQRCQKMCQDPLNLNLEVQCTNIEPKLHNLLKHCEKTWFLMIFCNFYSFSKIMQYGLCISAPNLIILIQWILAHHLTPLGHVNSGMNCFSPYVYCEM